MATSSDKYITLHSGGYISVSKNIFTGGYNIDTQSGTIKAGIIGIGLSGTPSTRLHVASYSTGSGQKNLRYFNYDTSSFSYTQLNDVCAIFDSSIWGKSWIASSSDIRIKKNIEDIDDDSALQKILAIQPKTYNYIDVVNKGDKKVYGFIAQQVNEVLPEAVTLQKEIIPNIYKLCDCSLNKIYIVLDVSTNTKIDIIDLSGNKETYTITEITENYITIDKEIKGSTCFVYGYEVDDFHTISKEYIFTLNVCATQELHRKIEAQQTKINELENTISAILARLDTGGLA